MPIAIRAITRIQDGDDTNLTLGAGQDGYAITWDNGTSKFVMSSAGGDTLPIADTTAVVKGSADATKLLRFEVDGFTTSTTRVLTPPDADATIAGLEVAQTFTAAQTMTAGLESYLNGITSSFIAGNAGNGTMSGANNVLIGTSCGVALTTGFNNVALGASVLFKATTGIGNFALGTGALTNLVGGSNNVAIGANAVNQNVSQSNNVGIGENALRNTTGRRNVGIGANALRNNTTAQHSVAIGHQAGYNSDVSGVVLIGYDAGYNNTTANALYIDNSNTANPLIYGEFNNGLVRVNGSSSATNSIVNTLGVNRLSTGTPAAGFGGALRFAAQSSTTANQDLARITTQWTTATHATRQGQLSLRVSDYTTERTVVSIGANGSAGLLGFYAATPIVKPAGTGETTGFTAGAGTGVNDDSTFTGNVGATAYRISDIVKALKNLGLLTS